MPKIKAIPKVEVESDVSGEDFSLLSDDQQLELLEVTFMKLIDTLEQSGIDGELISATLFNCFGLRMADMGDRAQFDLILEEALETEWEDITVH